MYMHVLQHQVFNNELLHVHVNELQSFNKNTCNYTGMKHVPYISFFPCAHIFRNVHESINVVKTEIV